MQCYKNTYTIYTCQCGWIYAVKNEKKKKKDSRMLHPRIGQISTIGNIKFMKE